MLPKLAQRRVWTGLNWSGLVWTALNGFELVWMDLNWFGLVWIGLNQLGTVWTGLNWFGTGLDCFELVWSTKGQSSTHWEALFPLDCRLPPVLVWYDVIHSSTGTASAHHWCSTQITPGCGQQWLEGVSSSLRGLQHWYSPLSLRQALAYELHLSGRGGN